MTITMTSIARHDRPRERLITAGAETLTDRELLALILRNGTNGASALDLAATLIAEHGGLAGLARARPEELSAGRGVGAAKAATVIAAFELARRLPGEQSEEVRLRSAEHVAGVARSWLSGLRRERVLVLVCDSSNRLQRTVRVSEGAIDRSLIPVREILNAVLRHDGRAFALAHNHPSGDAHPSDADRRATAEVAAGARAVGLRFLGHVIVAEDEWCQVS